MAAIGSGAVPFAVALPAIAAGVAVLVASALQRVYRLERARWLALAPAASAPGAGPLGTGGPAADATGSDGLAPARALYYGGTLLVGAQVLRAGSFTVSDGLYLISLGLGAAARSARRRPGRARSGRGRPTR